MLQGILKSKLSPALREGAFEVEDFLTSIALGACEYVAPELALIPFLETARDRELRPLRLAHLGIRRVTYAFWEYHPGVVVDGVTIAAGGEPELVVWLDTVQGRFAVLIEVKLGSEKSSLASEGSVVTDQLAKYWLKLRALAGEGALGVVYITKHAAMPESDLAASEEDANKQHDAPRFYWTHWRELTRIAKANESQSAILRDLTTVLANAFELPSIQTSWSWAAAPARCAEWTLSAWTWSPAPAVDDAWRFSWRWPTSPTPAPQWRFA
jgi:hypothetical protein